MIELKINKQSVDIEPNTNIRIELYFPFLEDDIKLAKTYWFDIPVTKTNARIFQFAHFIEIGERARAYDCVFSFSGVFSIAGKIVLSNITATKYRACVVETGLTTDDINTSLKNINYGARVTLGTTSQDVADYAADVLEDEYPDINFQFPVIFNESFYGDENNLFSSFVNNYNNGFEINAIANDEEANIPYNTLCPLLYLSFIFKKIAEHLAYNGKGVFFEQSELDKLLVYNNHPLDEVEETYWLKGYNPYTVEFGGTYKILFYNTDKGDENFTASSHIGWVEFTLDIVITHREGTNYNYTVEVYNYDKAEGLIVEQGTATSDSVELFINDVYFIPSSWVGDDIILLCNWECTEGTYHVVNTSQSQLNRFAKSLVYKNHVPDITINTLFNAIRKLLGIAIFFNHDKKIIQFVLWKDIINSTSYIDLTEKVIKDTYEINIAEQYGITFKYDWPSSDELSDKNFKTYTTYNYIGVYNRYENLPQPTIANQAAKIKNTNIIYVSAYEEGALIWKYYTDSFFEYKIGNGEKEIKPECGTMVMRYHDIEGVKFITPSIKQPATTPLFEQGDNEFGLHLIFYRGMHSNSNEDVYPYASSIKYNYHGSSCGSYSLIFDGTEGLVENFIADYAAFMQQSEVVKRRFKINVVDLMRIQEVFSTQESSNIRKIRINGINYIPKKFTAVLSASGVNDCEMELVKQINL